MLTNLSIQNIVLIKNLSIFLGHKLSVFTGETGAGKSILLNALSLAIGGKASISLIRNGENTASVTAVFSVDSNHNVISLLNEHDIPYDKNNYEIITRRVITIDGKSKAYVNDVPVSLSVLKSIGETLVEIHGQFDNQGLMNQANHIKILDNFGDLSSNVKYCEQLFHNWKNIEKDRIALEDLIKQAKTNEEYIKYNLDELLKLNPSLGEEEVLTEQRKQFIENKKINLSMQDAVNALNPPGYNVSSSIRNCINYLNSVSNIDSVRSIIDVLEEIVDKLDNTVYELEKIATTNVLNINVDEIESRLFKIHELSRKHNCLPSELPNILIKFSNLLSGIENNDDKLRDLKILENKSRQDYFSFANELHEKRVKCALKLSEKVCIQLPALKLEKAKFIVTVNKVNDDMCTSSGIDSVEFIVSTNTGMQSGVIGKIVSGGELARFVLAVKVALSSANPISTFVFDELDTGISGSTATAVGERLLELSKNMQVMLVTHSAQVASFATHHFKITKEVIFDSNNKESIETKICQLDPDGRILEIARIISDDKISDTAINQAKHLLNKNV